ncbi:hypothetical protein B0H65DRAFT_547033 [Neurospora tetraspora]|uniref:Uncharacterized protein n=1 Tax=Neurospora tetraspora TaxID=94610 RepID=A0AAE0JLW1_9PEZI|nr:hypothetical protein B0H65DRAFT_547033 [Neurospora tetraspora]
MSFPANTEITARISRDQTAVASKKLLTDSELALMAMKKARHTIKYSTIYDRGAWMTAAEFATKKIKALEAEAKYLRHLANLNEDEDADEPEEVRDAALLIEKTKAATLEKHLYQRQVDRITRGEAAPRSLASLTACYLGIGIEKEGTGKITRVERSQYRRTLLKEYDA